MDTRPTTCLDDGLREVTVGSVALSVPAAWVSTPNGCEAFLGRGTYLHAPGELGKATCGSVPSLAVVSTDRELGRALIRYPLKDRVIGGVRVRVGDSCLPTAACIYANGLLAYLPADDVVLVVSAGTARTDALAQGIVDSIRSPTSRN